MNVIEAGETVFGFGFGGPCGKAGERFADSGPGGWDRAAEASMNKRFY
ncbi:hypothetical protein LGN07_11820 [Burkholderia cepacia]|nr:hypothetical protein [Burkholderia cepacia]MCA8119403.1 hypothetical protein [Burkholderia cepacia]